MRSAITKPSSPKKMERPQTELWAKAKSRWAVAIHSLLKASQSPTLPDQPAIVLLKRFPMGSKSF